MRRIEEGTEIRCSVAYGLRATTLLPALQEAGYDEETLAPLGDLLTSFPGWAALIGWKRGMDPDEARSSPSFFSPDGGVYLPSFSESQGGLFLCKTLTPGLVAPLDAVLTPADSVDEDHRKALGSAGWSLTTEVAARAARLRSAHEP